MTSWISSRCRSSSTRGSTAGMATSRGRRRKPEDNPATWAPQVGQVPWLRDEVPLRRWRDAPHAERAPLGHILRRVHPADPADAATGRRVRRRVRPPAARARRGGRGRGRGGGPPPPPPPPDPPPPRAPPRHDQARRLGDQVV